jgi:hypothetical protein
MHYNTADYQFTILIADSNSTNPFHISDSETFFDYHASAKLSDPVLELVPKTHPNL